MPMPSASNGSTNVTNDVRFRKSPITIIVTILRLVFLFFGAWCSSSATSSNYQYKNDGSNRLLSISSSICQQQQQKGSWLIMNSFPSILIKPTMTLDHVREANAIQQLIQRRGNDEQGEVEDEDEEESSSRWFGRIYNANHTIKLPPLLLIIMLKILNFCSSSSSSFFILITPELIFGLLLLVIDYCIAYLLEEIGRNILWTSSSLQTTNNDNYTEEEEENASPSTSSSLPSSQVETEDEKYNRLPEVLRARFEHIFPVLNHYPTAATTATTATTDTTDGAGDDDDDGRDVNEQVPTENVTTTTTTTSVCTTPLLSLYSFPLLAAYVYYLSPITTLSSGFYYYYTNCCFQNLPFCCLVSCLYYCIVRRTTKDNDNDDYNANNTDTDTDTNPSITLAAFYLALATYMEVYHIVYVFPMIVMIFISQEQQQQQQNRLDRTDKKHQKDRKRIKVIIFFIVSYCGWTYCLQWLSYNIVQSEMTSPSSSFASTSSFSNYYHTVISDTYGPSWNNIGPSLSVQWYFHMQLFSRFRRYFATITSGLPYLLVLPLSIRFSKYPMVLITALTFVITIFRPVQTLYDGNICLCLLLLCPKSLARMNVPGLVALISIIVPIALNVVGHWMWLQPNTGNPNYMFFQCLVYNIFLAIIFGQFCSASLQHDKAFKLLLKEESSSTTTTTTTTTTITAAAAPTPSSSTSSST